MAHCEPVQVLKIRCRVSGNAEIGQGDVVRAPIIFGVPEGGADAVKKDRVPFVFVDVDVFLVLLHPFVNRLGDEDAPICLLLNGSVWNCDAEEILWPKESGLILARAELRDAGGFAPVHANSDPGLGALIFRWRWETVEQVINLCSINTLNPSNIIAHSDHGLDTLGSCKIHKSKLCFRSHSMLSWVNHLCLQASQFASEDATP